MAFAGGARVDGGTTGCGGCEAERTAIGAATAEGERIGLVVGANRVDAGGIGVGVRIRVGGRRGGVTGGSARVVVNVGTFARDAAAKWERIRLFCIINLGCVTYHRNPPLL